MGRFLNAAKEYRKVIDAAGAMLTNEQAAEVPSLYKEWEVGIAYAVGDRRTYKGGLYSCLQAHTSQEDWAPDVAPSLWATR